MINEYETQKTLNPILWNGDTLKPKLRDGFMRIANAFYEFLEIDTPILDVIIIGSSANYNWTEHSDIDLHVVINYSEVGDNMLLVQNYMNAKKSVWNTNYPLTLKGMNIELYAQDSNENLNSTIGIYSLTHNKWINKPSSETISIDDSAIEQKAQPYKYEIDSLNSNDPKLEFKIRNLLNRLRHLRQTGLNASGEYSIENMAFKYLRNKGYLERLKQFQKKITMKQLAVESVITLDKTKQKVRDFVAAMRNERDETKLAFTMLVQHMQGRKLNDTEWRWVREQMKDVIKMLGMTTMAVAPGGTLVALLMKALKVDKHILPSSFKKKHESQVTENLIAHVTRKRTLTPADWDDIVVKTGGVEDAMGQWSHPGRCTMIPTTDGAITMQDVPHKVLGIDDTGHCEMMHPEQRYQFPGKRVFEIPHTAQWQTMIMQIQNAIKNGSRYAK